MRAVLQSFIFAFASAPFSTSFATISTSIATISVHQFSLDFMRAVLPSLFIALTSAPFFSSIATISVCQRLLALTRAVKRSKGTLTCTKLR